MAAGFRPPSEMSFIPLYWQSRRTISLSRKRIMPGAAALAAIIALSAIAAPIAHAATVITIHPADLDTSDTRTAGHVSFRTDGLNVWTDDATSLAKAAGYYPMSGPIPTTASFVWRGTDTQPGMQIVFDADGINGNGNDWNILVGETVYGDNWWLSNGSTLDRTLAPHNGGGYGSPYYGTLTEWATALPDARVLAGGFSLGSGAKGNGVIDSMTYGATTYNFSSVTPVVKTVANVHGTSAITVRPHGVRVDLRSQPQPDEHRPRPEAPLGRQGRRPHGPQRP